MRAAMKANLTVTLLIMTVATAALAQMPAGLSVYTWTREDIFAGLLSKDYERMKAGMAKLEDILKQEPDNADAIAMKAAGIGVLAFRDLEKGDKAGFDRQYEQSVGMLDEALRLNPRGVGVNAVYGATMLFYMTTLPEDRRAHALEKAKQTYSFLYKAQEKAVDQMPLHLKGELLAGMAEVEYRSGNRDQATAYLKRIVDTMPNTLYATRAQQWLENPQTASQSRLVCASCHEPGRLKNRLPQPPGR